MAARKKSTTRKKPQYVRAKKRKGGDSSLMARRSFSIVVLLLIVATILFGIFQGFRWVGRKLYSNNPRFEIQHLVISTDGKLREEQIREYLEVREGDNLWAFSFEDISDRMGQVAVVESVYLERQLPNTLIVKVKERVAMARIILPSISTKIPYTIDRYGYVLPPRLKATALPLIKGLDPDVKPGDHIGHPDIEVALKIVGMCESTGYLRSYVRIESLDLKYQDFIDMRLQGGTRVRMPRFSLKQKLQNLATIIKIANDQGRRVKDVDLTLDTAKVPVTYY